MKRVLTGLLCLLLALGYSADHSERQDIQQEVLITILSPKQESAKAGSKFQKKQPKRNTG